MSAGNDSAIARRRLFSGLGFISPWIAGFAIFTVFPLVASLYYSFCDYDVLSRRPAISKVERVWLLLGSLARVAFSRAA